MESSAPVNSPSYRIAILGTRGIPARYGGFETFAEQLSKRLVMRGHSVLVYGRCGFLSRWGTRESISGVERRDTPTVFHKYLETPIHALTSFVDMLRQPVDAVILCNAANSPFAPLLLLKRRPLLINVDGIERNRAKWNSLGKAWYLLGECCSVKFASRVVSDAEVIAEYYRDTYGVSSTVIPYGVHPERRQAGETLAYYSLEPKNYLLYVSRLEPENNALGVIQAYTRLNTTMPLVIVGDAPYATEYKQKLKAAANERVIFTGFQFGNEYQELQSNCYLYIQATEVGGTHPALIESMSYGNCVVSNGTPENREVVADVGICFEKNNFQQLTAVLDRLLVDPQTVQEMGARAKKRAYEKYSWDSVVSRYEELITELVAERVALPPAKSSHMPGSKQELPIVIFDGECGFCSRLVSLILRYERSKELLFSPNSSPVAVELLTRHNLVHASAQTIVIVSGENTLIRSDAVVFLARHLRPPFSYLRFLEYVPKSIRDLGYKVVAASRRFLPGGRDVCSLLSPEQQNRIILEKPIR